MLQPDKNKSIAPSGLLAHEPWRRAKPTDARFIDMEGHTFGVWFVLGYAGKPGTHPLWQCRCTECGKEKLVDGFSVRSGHSASCGCPRNPSRPPVDHGLSSHEGYTSWISMIARCERPTNPDWARYGGRGIRVCPRWSDHEAGLINFLADMGTRPDGMSIERIDGDGNYEPGNCRWATRAEQARNRRNNRTLTFQGTTLTMSTWASKIGVHSKALAARLKAGWTLEQALTTPARVHNRGKILHAGRAQSLSAWARQVGLTASVLRGRFCRGWSIKQALETPMNGAKV